MDHRPAQPWVVTEFAQVAWTHYTRLLRTIITNRDPMK